MFGGVKEQGAAGGEHTAVTEVLVLAADGAGSWFAPTITGPQPEPRAFHAACAVGHRVYVYGGHVLSWDAAAARKKRVFYNDLWALDTESWTWEPLHLGGTLPDVPPRRDMATLTPLEGGGLLLYGGRGEPGRCVGDAWVWDISRKAWMGLRVAGGPQPSPRKMHGAVAVGGRLLVLGGERDNGVCDDLWSLKLPPGPITSWALRGGDDGGRWTKISVRPAPGARFGHALAGTPPAQPRALVCSGGCVDATPFLSLTRTYAQCAELWTLDLASFSWVRAPDSHVVQASTGAAGPSERMCHSLTPLSGGRLLMVGGRRKEGVCTDAWWLSMGSQPPTTATSQSTSQHGGVSQPLSQLRTASSNASSNDISMMASRPSDVAAALFAASQAGVRRSQTSGDAVTAAPPQLSQSSQPGSTGYVPPMVLQQEKGGAIPNVQQQRTAGGAAASHASLIDLDADVSQPVMHGSHSQASQPGGPEFTGRQTYEQQQQQYEQYTQNPGYSRDNVIGSDYGHRAGERQAGGSSSGSREYHRMDSSTAMALRAAQEASRYEAVRMERFGLPPTPQPPTTAVSLSHLAAAGASSTGGVGPGSEALQRAMEQLGGQLLIQHGAANYQRQQLPHGPEAVTACRRHLAALAPDDATSSQLDLVLLDYGRLLAVAGRHSSGSSGPSQPKTIQDLMALTEIAPLKSAHLAATAAAALATASREQLDHTAAVPHVSDVLRVSDVPVLLEEYRRLVGAACC